MSPKFEEHCITISLKLLQVSRIPFNIYKNIPHPLKFFANIPCIPKDPSRASFILNKKPADEKVTQHAKSIMGQFYDFKHVDRMVFIYTLT